MESDQKAPAASPREQLRLFIALSLPDAVKDQVEKAQADLRRALPIGSVRWTGREQLHLTLKFLGNVNAQRVEALTDSLRHACEILPALRLRAEGISFFPQNSTPAPAPRRAEEDSVSSLALASTLLRPAADPSRLRPAFQKKPLPRLPRVIWVGVKDSPGNLLRLQSAVELAMRDFSREKSEENFTGHVTLGRVKDLKRHEAESFLKLAAGVSSRFFGKWTADHIELIHSELLPGGPRYSTLATVPLLSNDTAT